MQPYTALTTVVALKLVRMKTSNKEQFDNVFDSDDTSLLAFDRDTANKEDCCELKSFLPSCLCDPHRIPYRYIILILLCYIEGTTMYAIEKLGGIENTIIQVMRIDTTQYDLLFSAFTWPNIILCLVGGIVIDRLLGLRYGFLLVTVMSILGEIIFAVGAFIDSYLVMLIGRFILGSGVELVSIVVHAYQAIWFLGKEISFAMSLGMSSSRFAGAIGLIIPQVIYDSFHFISDPNYRLGATLMVGVLALISSLFCCLIVILLDKRGEKLLDRTREPLKIKKITLQDIKDFSISFWLVTVVSTIYYPVVFSFSGIGQLFFVNKYRLSIIDASVANSLVFGAVIVFTPLIGILIDILGYNLAWAQCGVVIGIVCHLMYATSSGESYLPYLIGILYSVSYSFFGISIWPVPALIVQEHQLATAYGFTKSPYNLGYAVITIITGVIIDYAGYLFVHIYYLLLLYIVFILLIAMWILEAVSNKSKINISGWTRRKRLKREKEKTFGSAENESNDLFSYDGQ